MLFSFNALNNRITILCRHSKFKYFYLTIYILIFFVILLVYLNSKHYNVSIDFELSIRIMHMRSGYMTLVVLWYIIILHISHSLID